MTERHGNTFNSTKESLITMSEDREVNREKIDSHLEELRQDEPLFEEDEVATVEADVTDGQHRLSHLIDAGNEELQAWFGIEKH